MLPRPPLLRNRILLLATLLVTIPVLLLLLSSLLRHSATGAPDRAYVRVNQVGYTPGAMKQAILMATGSESGASFSLVNQATGQSIYSAPIGPSRGSWNHNFPTTYLLDFTSVKTHGRYSIQVNGPIAASSPTFQIDTGANLYTKLLSNALFFYQAQHDGHDVNQAVMSRQPSHLTDQSASVYSPPAYVNGVLQGTLHNIGGPIDVAGGWFDAGDYLKFVETASYTDAIMLLAVRQYPHLSMNGGADFTQESIFGLDWLQKMWDNTNRVLYYQVGLGDGNGTSILGDHDSWRLPQADDQRNVQPGDPVYYVKYRPVFRAGPSGAAISPNLAGRLAADLGLCYQLYQVSMPAYAIQCLLSAETIFDLARTSNVGQLLTTSPYDYYPEVEWRDDLELGATELYFAVAIGNPPPGLPHTDPVYYLQQAAHWAHAYMHSPNHGSDSLNFYDVSGLAHYELYHALIQAGNPDNVEVSKADLLADLRSQLANGAMQAKADPFGLGIAYGNGQDATPHALGYALEASFYDELAGVNTYTPFGLTQLNWVLGANAWGSSFIVGAGSTFPHCLQHQVANLSGSLDGRPPILLGATVDGPNATAAFAGLSFPDGARKCPVKGGDLFGVFSSKGARYVDNVVDYPSVEPADDYTALSVFVFARQSLGF